MVHLSPAPLKQCHRRHHKLTTRSKSHKFLGSGLRSSWKEHVDGNLIGIITAAPWGRAIQGDEAEVRPTHEESVQLDARGNQERIRGPDRGWGCRGDSNQETTKHATAPPSNRPASTSGFASPAVLPEKYASTEKIKSKSLASVLGVWPLTRTPVW